MAEAPQLGDLVAVTTTDSEPWLVVTQVEADTIEGVLLADCAEETLRRLAATVDDAERRRDLARVLRRAGLPKFTLPPTSYRRPEPAECRHRFPVQEGEW